MANGSHWRLKRAYSSRGVKRRNLVASLCEATAVEAEAAGRDSSGV